jgi:hypothetical protein
MFSRIPAYPDFAGGACAATATTEVLPSAALSRRHGEVTPCECAMGVTTGGSNHA